MNNANNRNWVLWLDDVRVPYVENETTGEKVFVELDQFKHTSFPVDGVVWCKTTHDAKAMVLERGLPGFMYLDHDLGNADTSMEFLHWLAVQDFQTAPPDYYVISANPVGSQNIRAFMESWKKAAKL